MGILQDLGILEKKDTPENKPVVQLTTPTYPLNTVVTSTDGEGFSKLLEGAMEKRNIPGPDFFEFYKTLKNLQSQPLPEQQKYIIAFTGLQVMGLTKEKAIDTSSTYLKALDDEEKEFQESINSFTAREITDKTEESQKLSQENLDLQKRIQDNMNKISELNIAIAQNQQKVISKTQQFNADIEKEKASIAAIVQNIKTYL